MAGTISSYQQGAFTSPVENDPLDASVPLANDNAIRGKHNSHDADASIHMQASTLGNRPAAATQRPWYTTDGLRVYFDNGSTWNEAAYLSIAAGGTVGGATTFTAGLSGTITQANQPNITTLGTLASLAVTGIASAGTMTAGAHVASAAKWQGIAAVTGLSTSTLSIYTYPSASDAYSLKVHISNGTNQSMDTVDVLPGNTPQVASGVNLQGTVPVRTYSSPATTDLRVVLASGSGYVVTASVFEIV